MTGGDKQRKGLDIDLSKGLSVTKQVPKWPVPRLIADNSFPGILCEECGSSLKWNSIFGSMFGWGGNKGCIQPLCSNYYLKEPEEDPPHKEVCRSLEEEGVPKLTKE